MRRILAALTLLAAFNLHVTQAQPASTPDPRRAAPAPSPSGATGFISVRDGRFIDAQGRQVLLHGLCVISKNKAENYQSWQGPADFAAMRDWGMNCIRLGILWDGLEPQPGVFDEAYLKAVDQRIAWAKAAGIHVFLDMHQDLYSYKYSDGAPEWATLTDDQPHLTGGDVWSDAYVLSPAIQRAFDNFWVNKPCADGEGQCLIICPHRSTELAGLASKHFHQPNPPMIFAHQYPRLPPRS
jgi:hypothetical protein